MKKRSIIISAVNLVEGGGLGVFVDCLSCLSESEISIRYNVIALVNSKSLFPNYVNIQLIECPTAKKHYLYRFYYEYIEFNRISKKLKPILWLSLHDMTPRVKADIQAVYMHNSIPFYTPKWLDWKLVPINAVWAYLYKFVYRINIHSNNYLVVQQQWLRDEFSKMFNFEKEKIIVARPVNSASEPNILSSNSNRAKRDNYQFVYPAFPRVFKNFEVICEAAKLLYEEGINNVSIVLTIDGSENKYSSYLKQRYGNVRLLEFKGLVERNKMKDLYEASDCLLFPSKLETWGLPLSEFKPYGKPIIAADLPYAHESASGAKKVLFVPAENARELAKEMKKVASGDDSSFYSLSELEISKPTSSSWEELFRILLGE